MRLSTIGRPLAALLFLLTAALPASAQAQLALSQRSLNLPAGGPCIFTAGDGFQSTINLTNPGTAGSSTVVTGGTISGPDAASFAFNPPPTFPITIAAAAAAVPVVVLYGPPVGAVGPQNATLTLTYTLDGGAPQTVSIPLSGTSDAKGAGFVFRGTLSDAACSNGAALPSGTAFLSIATHTRITALSADDAVSTYTIPAAFGPLRMFGVNYTTLRITSNGTVGLGTTPTPAVGFYGGARSTVAANFIQVIAQDLNMATGTYDTGAAADPGTFIPGVYTGLSDADGDGAVDDLVITYYHAYAYNSPAYGAATPSTAQYMTAQLVIIKATRANEDDYAEVRYIDGTEPVSNVPYRLNTATFDPATQPTSMEGYTTTAITDATGAEGALYRLQSFGGPLYAAGGNVAVRFQAEAQAIARGNSGYRMMGVPVRNYTVGRLAGVNLVQGVTGQYPQAPGPNLFTGYDGAAYTAATNITNALTPGRGFFWVLYNRDLTPTSPAPHGAGTSRSYALPMRLEGTGAEPVVTTGGVPVTLTTTGDKFNLVANPFREDLDVSTLGTWATGGTLTSNVPQVWDPNVGGSGSYVEVTGTLSTWQGFFIENNTATGLLVPTNARNEAGAFLGRSGTLYANAAASTLAFELTGTDAATGLSTVDRAATLSVRDAEATDGWDVWDASKLAPLSAAYATVGFQGSFLDGSPRVKAQESRATDATSFDVPLVVDAVGTAPELTLSWAGLDALPEGWALELRDIVTGATVDLRTVQSYTFEQMAAPALSGDALETVVARTTTAAQAKAGAAPRFELHVATGRATATEGEAVTEFALAAPAPNPTAGSARVAFALPAEAAVSVVLYDALGRKVATLAEGQMTAGRHEARLDASALAPGVYVVRMTAGTFAAAQRLTVVR